MAREGFEIVVIKKSGPTQSMKVHGWWITLILIVVLLIGAALGAGAFILYRQYWVVSEIAEDTRLLMFRTERLEALVQEQETRELLISQQSQQSTTATTTSPQVTEPSESVQTATDEPATSSILSMRNVKQNMEAGNLSISFDIVNEQGSEPAVGYIAVIAHGSRQGKPWIEAWPPMRLNEQGRPEQYRRGTPFSIQRFRTVRARMALADKAFERLEFVFYSRQGDVMLVSSYPVSPTPPEPETTESNSDSEQ